MSRNRRFFKSIHVALIKCNKVYTFSFISSNGKGYGTLPPVFGGCGASDGGAGASVEGGAGASKLKKPSRGFSRTPWISVYVHYSGSSVTSRLAGSLGFRVFFSQKMLKIYIKITKMLSCVQVHRYVTLNTNLVKRF